MAFPTYIPMQQPTMQPKMGQGGGYAPRPMMQPQPMWQMYGTAAALIKVNGRAGADAYFMGPNEAAALFDENDDIFFFKTTDGAGYATIKPFRFEPLPEQGAAPAVAYATQEEVERLRAEVFELKGVLNNGKQPVRKTAAKTDAAADE